jgi:phage portal protein BeeE
MTVLLCFVFIKSYSITRVDSQDLFKVKYRCIQRFSPHIASMRGLINEGSLMHGSHHLLNLLLPNAH